MTATNLIVLYVSIRMDISYLTEAQMKASSA